MEAMTTHEERVLKAMKARKSLIPQARRSRWRQRFHFMAPAGWINDPNGCIYHEGRYHLFYQHNPCAGRWAAMHWGHAVSADLLHWEHLPIALAPSETYDDHPEGGVFSGSVAANGEELAALYTATTKIAARFVQTQCLATSADGGLTFRKYEANPLIPAPPPGTSSDFRDPKVIRHGNLWYMVVGASLGGGAHAGGEGCCMLYASPDLRRWEYRGIIARSGGKLGTMWECPDLFPLGGQWALTFSPMFSGDKTTVYFVGDMDFENARFHSRNSGELDRGGDYYAVQSMAAPDGRTLLMAWQNGWDWMPGWKGFGPAPQDGWCGNMALPRSVRLDGKNRITSQPADETRSLRRDEWTHSSLAVDAVPFPVPCADPVCFELALEIDITRTSARRLHVDLRGNGEQRTRLTLNFSEKRMLLNRTRADGGITDGIRDCPLALETNSMDLRIFSDTTSLEVFADGGKACMSANIYPADREFGGSFLSTDDGTVAMLRVSSWRLAATVND